jgi:hypothetical protein
MADRRGSLIKLFSTIGYSVYKQKNDNYRVAVMSHYNDQFGDQPAFSSQKFNTLGYEGYLDLTGSKALTHALLYNKMCTLRDSGYPTIILTLSSFNKKILVAGVEYKGDTAKAYLLGLAVAVFGDVIVETNLGNYPVTSEQYYCSGEAVVDPLTQHCFLEITETYEDGFFDVFCTSHHEFMIDAALNAQQKCLEFITSQDRDFSRNYMRIVQDATWISAGETLIISKKDKVRDKKTTGIKSLLDSALLRHVTRVDESNSENSYFDNDEGSSIDEEELLTQGENGEEDKIKKKKGKVDSFVGDEKASNDSEKSDSDEVVHSSQDVQESQLKIRRRELLMDSLGKEDDKDPDDEVSIENQEPPGADSSEEETESEEDDTMFGTN